MDKASLQWQAMAEMPDNSRFLPNSPRVVEILAYPAVQLLDVAGPLQVFASANELTARDGEPPLYAARVVSAGAPVVTASAGLGLVANPGEWGNKGPLDETEILAVSAACRTSVVSQR